MDLVRQLLRHDVMIHGSFTLKSGLLSPVYFDLKRVISYPKLMANISYELSKLVDRDGILCGVPYGGIPYACTISQINNMPMIMIRDEKKGYGMQRQIEGELFGKEVILIEDVITTGSSVINVINLLRKCNVIVKQIVCILDREAGGVIELTKMGYKVTNLLTLAKCLQYTESVGGACDEQISNSKLIIKNTITQKLLKLINEKKTNLIISLDVCKTEELLDMLELIGDHICAVKIHFDIFNLIGENFMMYLDDIKKRKRFLVIEDRKFADIPYISLKQLDIIPNIADIITVHGICGESLIKELNNRNIGLLPVHMLSIEGNLIDTTYSNKLLDICKKYDNIVGFVSQEKIDNYLTFSPGIKLIEGTDGMGQCYKTISDCNNDIFIVGRGIYESDNILETTIAYKIACFDKWKY